MNKTVGNSRSELVHVWNRLLDRLAERVKPEDLNHLIRPLKLRAVSPTEVRLEAPNKLALVCITDNYLPTIRQVVDDLLGPRQVAIDLPLREQGELFPKPHRARSQERSRSDCGLIDKYTFANFIVGASNQFAHAASNAVANQPGDHYNPLFIYGGVGLGKTHLVNAVGHQILQHQSMARVAYLSSDAFMSDLISSLRRDTMTEFKERFRRVDVLIVDDVQLLAGRERTQEEFFHTFNTLYDHRRQIILTSDKVPKEIPELEERLRNRFEWGLVADIQPPDVETRIAIVEKKAEMEHIELPDEVALFLAKSVPSNVRELEGCLTKIAAHSSLSRQPITLESAREVLHGVLKSQRRLVSFDAITDAVCEHFSLRPSDLRSRRRSRNVAVPRQVAMYLCRHLMNASFPHIGELFDRDHSTVIYATTAIERRIRHDVNFQAALETIERAIHGE